jgi:hypothetical protein
MNPVRRTTPRRHCDHGQEEKVGSPDQYHAPVALDDEHGDFEHEFGPLEQRLRNMNWPDIEPGLRERCWRDFQRRIDGAEPGETSADDDA